MFKESGLVAVAAIDNEARATNLDAAAAASPISSMVTLKPDFILKFGLR
jgi:hypothetical protein